MSGEGEDRFASYRLPRGRHGLSPEQVAESQRLRLLLAAGEVLCACGYKGVTGREICRQAGTSTSTFYSHFDDVDACLLASHAMAVDSLWELVSAACAGPGAWPERLRAALDAALGFLGAEPHLARLLGSDLAIGVPAIAVSRERLLERLAGLLCGARRLRLASAEELPASIETHLAGAVLLLLSDRIVAGELAMLPTLTPELAEVLARPYLSSAG